MPDAELILSIVYAPPYPGDGEMYILRARSGHYLPVSDGRFAWLIDPDDGRAVASVSRNEPGAAEEWLLEAPGHDPLRPELTVVWADSAPIAAELYAEGIRGIESL